VLVDGAVEVEGCVVTGGLGLATKPKLTTKTITNNTGSV